MPTKQEVVKYLKENVNEIHLVEEILKFVQVKKCNICGKEVIDDQYEFEKPTDQEYNKICECLKCRLKKCKYCNKKFIQSVYNNKCINCDEVLSCDDCSSERCDCCDGKYCKQCKDRFKCGHCKKHYCSQCKKECDKCCKSLKFEIDHLKNIMRKNRLKY